MAKPETDIALTKLGKDFRNARFVSTPIIGITTTDQAATIDMLSANVIGRETSGKEPATPILTWDVCRGITSNQKEGRKLVAENGWTNPEATQMPHIALMEAMKLPPGAVLFVINAHLFLQDPNVIQAVWNCRDQFKVNRRTLVLLAPMFRLTPELESDVIVLDEPLPTHDELRDIILQICNVIGHTPDPDTLERAIDAVTGLPAFTAEQVVAMSLKKSGLDIDALWERKRQSIEQTPGLSVNRSSERFADVGGCANIKGFLPRVLKGKRRPKVVVFLDEVEKAFAGAGSGGFGDSSGVSQDQLGQLLTYMADNEATGLIFIGPPGSAKSMVAKAAGNEAGVPTITFDLGGMKGSLVGESEARIRGALKVVTAVGSGKALFIATCNSIGVLPPELRRRFKRGIFFFDLPTREEREEIWKLKETRYSVPQQPRPADKDWTGDEIGTCCDLADDLGMTLLEASKFIVPVARSAGAVIERLREQSSGNFLSASRPGVYEYKKAQPEEDDTPAPKVPVRAPRAMSVS